MSLSHPATPSRISAACPPHCRSLDEIRARALVHIAQGHDAEAAVKLRRELLPGFVRIFRASQEIADAVVDSGLPFRIDDIAEFIGLRLMIYPTRRSTGRRDAQPFDG
jgi:hypothetical protein